MAILIVSRDLTTDAMTLCRTRGATIIVTRPASHFCHGANVLRYWAANGRMVKWLVSDAVDDLPVIPIAVDGWYDRERGLLKIQIPKHDSFCRVALHVRDPVDLPRRSKERIAVSLTGRRIGMLPMSSRTYDVLTASVMIPGLDVSATALNGAPARVLRTRSGHLVLSAKHLSLGALVEVAASPTKGRPHLEHQMGLYKSLLKRWQCNGPSSPGRHAISLSPRSC